jgi:hypothetical protein
MKEKSVHLADLVYIQKGEEFFIFFGFIFQSRKKQNQKVFLTKTDIDGIIMHARSPSG